MGAVKAAIGDGVLTFMWVFFASTIGAATTVIAAAVGVEGMASLAITTSLIFIFVSIFGVIANAFGGASFSPTDIAASYAVGLGGDTLVSAALRLPAQAVGAALGVLAIHESMPLKYKHMLEGPSLKVDLHTGAIAEGVLTFAITFAVFCIFHKGPKSSHIKNLMLSMTTMALLVAGSAYTGPSMNPAIAFGWAYANNRHNTLEQLYVYWICPFVGAIFAAWLFRLVFPPATPSKQKTA